MFDSFLADGAADNANGRATDATLRMRGRASVAARIMGCTRRGVNSVGALLAGLLIGALPAAAQTPAKPAKVYYAWVGAESADVLQRIRFGPDGATLDKTIPIGEQAAEMEGPHGLIISKDKATMYMTTGHGTPDGKLWTYALGPDTLVAPGILLGNFPATLDISPDGLYAIISNFNLHGDMVPSSMSVVYTPENTEVARIVTCTMPHGSRFEPSGRFQYSGCMMDDQLVEIDAGTFSVSRRFSLARGKEGPLAVAASGHDMGGMSHDMHAADGAKPAPAPKVGPVVDPADIGYNGMQHTMAPNSCSPTWAQPSVDGKVVYVACNKMDEIIEVDRASWQITRRIKSGRGPYNLGVSPDGKLLVATLKQSAGFEIFDIATGQSLALLKNSTTVANGVAISDDSKYAFVASEGVGAAPGKVDIYDLAARVKVATVDVAQQAGGIAFWKAE